MLALVIATLLATMSGSAKQLLPIVSGDLGTRG